MTYNPASDLYWTYYASGDMLTVSYLGKRISGQVDKSSKHERAYIYYLEFPDGRRFSGLDLFDVVQFYLTNNTIAGFYYTLPGILNKTDLARLSILFKSIQDDIMRKNRRALAEPNKNKRLLVYDVDRVDGTTFHRINELISDYSIV